MTVELRHLVPEEDATSGMFSVEELFGPDRETWQLRGEDLRDDWD